MGHTIVSVAYPLTDVSLDAVGGSEQILTLLDRALKRAGHRSLVIAAEGSRVEGTLIASPPARGTLDDGQRQWAQKIHNHLLRETLARFPVDLVHMHSLDFHRYVPEGDVPVLATLHLPPDWYPRDIFSLKRPNFYLNCVSSSQRRACPRAGAPVQTIPNGVDVARFGGPIVKRNYVLAMGRICPERDSTSPWTLPGKQALSCFWLGRPSRTRPIWSTFGSRSFRVSIRNAGSSAP